MSNACNVERSVLGQPWRWRRTGGVEADNTSEPAVYELPTTDYDECLACQ